MSSQNTNRKVVSPHHAAWLAAHPERSEAWLWQMLSEGFDVHHINGDSRDNSPANLVLIEHADHMRLHEMPLFSVRYMPREQCAGRPRKRRAKIKTVLAQYEEATGERLTGKLLKMAKAPRARTGT